MTLQGVFDQYIKAISKQLKRRNRRDVGNSFTSNEEKAIAQYGRAAQQIKTLIDQPTVVVPDSGLKFHRL